MRRLLVLLLWFVCLWVNPVCAQDEVWTEIGIYGFMPAITGEAQIGDTTSDVDVPFSDILENLEMGFMALVEHRRGRWSFIVDVAYLNVGSENTKTTSSSHPLSVTLDATFKQTVAEGFIGYRLLAKDHGNAQSGIDLLAGARYNKLEAELDVQAAQLGLTTAASRNPSADWVDGVIALRGQYGHNNGWGVSGWADIGRSSDGSSYQLLGLVNYRFENNVRIFAGYRFLNIEYEGDHAAAPYELSLDYSGPTIGVSYRF